MISYGRQAITAEDIDTVVAVLKSDFLTQGPQVPRFEQALCQQLHAAHAVAANSATSALHLACRALSLAPGDRFWTSPISFVASANCGLFCGASVDFVDIDPHTFNICPEKLEQKLTRAAHQNQLPKLIIPVHLGGLPCDMAAIASLARRYDIKIIEDASHALGGHYQDHPIGSGQHSDITVFSFHPVKIITTGEGGAALTQSADLAETMRLLRSHGVTREQQKMLGESDGDWYYQQIELGYNYRLTDIQAALGTQQLSRLRQYVSRRQQLARRYDEAFADLPLRLQRQTPTAQSAYHLYLLRVPAAERKAVFNELRAKKIGAHVHYIPIHTQPYFQKMGFAWGDFPAAEAFYREALSIPLHPQMSDNDQQTVIRALRSYCKQQSFNKVAVL